MAEQGVGDVLSSPAPLRTPIRRSTLESNYIVEMKGISKQFGSVQALNQVDLELREGEILGLVGDNAAGKSTLMKILSGAHVADSGQIIINGEEVSIHHPRDARACGIEMIYQDLALCNNLDVARNIFLGREYTRGLPFLSILDKKKMYTESAALLKRLNINISSPRLKVERMSGGQRQMVAAAKAIAFDASILLMDEPTAALGVREANTLLRLIKDLRDEGHSIVLITQRIPDILAIGDRVMVLKGGRRQGILNVSEVGLDDVVELIVRGRAGAESEEDAMEYLSFG